VRGIVSAFNDISNIFSGNVDGGSFVDYDGERYMFLRIEGMPGTVQGLRELLDSVYTEEGALMMHSMIDRTTPPFFRDIDGQLAMLTEHEYAFPLLPVITGDEFEITSASIFYEGTAINGFTALADFVWTNENIPPATMLMLFVPTNDGWRIQSKRFELEVLPDGAYDGRYRSYTPPLESFFEAVDVTFTPVFEALPPVGMDIEIPPRPYEITPSLAIEPGILAANERHERELRATEAREQEWRLVNMQDFTSVGELEEYLLKFAEEFPVSAAEFDFRRTMRIELPEGDEIITLSEEFFERYSETVREGLMRERERDVLVEFNRAVEAQSTMTPGHVLPVDTEAARSYEQEFATEWARQNPDNPAAYYERRLDFSIQARDGLMTQYQMEAQFFDGSEAEFLERFGETYSAMLENIERDIAYYEEILSGARERGDNDGRW
jgi:hypothetical protein